MNVTRMFVDTLTHKHSCWALRRSATQLEFSFEFMRVHHEEPMLSVDLALSRLDLRGHLHEVAQRITYHLQSVRGTQSPRVACSTVLMPVCPRFEIVCRRSCSFVGE
jgi:hypothetical protein